MIKAPILSYPNPELEYVVDSDASDTGVGAIFSQQTPDGEVVIAYYSKTLTWA